MKIGHFFCPFLKLKKTFPTKISLKNIINWNSYLKKKERPEYNKLEFLLKEKRGK